MPAGVMQFHLGWQNTEIQLSEMKHKIVVDSEYLLPENATSLVEGFPSGQRDQTVNLTVLPSEVRILPPPPFVFRVYYFAGVVQW